MAIWKNLDFHGSIFSSDEVMNLCVLQSSPVIKYWVWKYIWPYGQMFILIWIQWGTIYGYMAKCILAYGF